MNENHTVVAPACMICFSTDYAFEAYFIRKCHCDTTICSECAIKITKCVICRKELGQFVTISNMTVLNDIDEKIPWNCQDCHQVVKRIDYLHHQREHRQAGFKNISRQEYLETRQLKNKCLDFIRTACAYCIWICIVHILVIILTAFRGNPSRCDRKIC
jgi:hypothetical protein